MTAILPMSNPSPADQTHYAMLAVNDPSRERARGALLLCLWCAVAFCLFAALSTQDKALRAHSPWQDDPYDVVVSFTEFFVPLLAAALLARVTLCPRNVPAVAARLRDLLRAARLIVACVGLTLAADWVAVALGVHSRQWEAPGRLLIGTSAVLTALWLTSALALRAATGAGQWTRTVPSESDPDWVGDLFAVACAKSDAAGPFARPLRRGVESTERVLINGRWGVRRHAIVAAALMSVLFGLGVGLTQVVGEDGLRQALRHVAGLGLFVGIGAAGMFCFLLAVGTYLRPLGPPTQRLTPARLRWLRAAAIATCSVPVTVALRTQLAALTGGALASSNITQFARTIGLVAVGAGAVALAAQLALSRRQR